MILLEIFTFLLLSISILKLFQSNFTQIQSSLTKCKGFSSLFHRKQKTELFVAAFPWGGMTTPDLIGGKLRLTLPPVGFGCIELRSINRFM
ncbi:MAG: hypothetical protein A2167_07600 [Planctomycetes bacterium RBG_13_46_10]|nr:MAG: hypothetical protein A2167_07600 [Planctomycetes bacterium RBG_13_46_10]